MVFISCAATALRKREIKASKSTSLASWPGFIFAGFVSWAAVFFLGGVVQPPAARPNASKTKARHLTPAFIFDSFLSFPPDWQARPCCCRAQKIVSQIQICAILARLHVITTPQQ